MRSASRLKRSLKTYPARFRGLSLRAAGGKQSQAFGLRTCPAPRGCCFLVSLSAGGLCIALCTSQSPYESYKINLSASPFQGAGHQSTRPELLLHHPEEDMPWNASGTMNMRFGSPGHQYKPTLCWQFCQSFRSSAANLQFSVGFFSRTPQI